MKHYDIRQARAVYANGGNVTEHLHKSLKIDHNTPQIIELAYDLQAGSYIDAVKVNMESALKKAHERVPLISPYLTEGKQLLDVGSGELTTLSLLLGALDVPVPKVFAFDISWSRIHVGKEFALDYLGEEASSLDTFVADMEHIPLASNSVDVVTSSHALEPNGKNIKKLLSELFRVCRDKLVLFEPSYELNSCIGKERMDRLGYIKNIEGEVAEIGGKVLSVTPLQHVDPMNPTVCYIVEPPNTATTSLTSDSWSAYTVPGTDFKLEKRSNFWFSEDTGLTFPDLQGIPVLKSNAAILASALAS